MNFNFNWDLFEQRKSLKNRCKLFHCPWWTKGLQLKLFEINHRRILFEFQLFRIVINHDIRSIRFKSIVNRRILWWIIELIWSEREKKHWIIIKNRWLFVGIILLFVAYFHLNLHWKKSELTFTNCEIPITFDGRDIWWTISIERLFIDYSRLIRWLLNLFVEELIDTFFDIVCWTFVRWQNVLNDRLSFEIVENLIQRMRTELLFRINIEGLIRRIHRANLSTVVSGKSNEFIEKKSYLIFIWRCFQVNKLFSVLQLDHVLNNY